MLEKCNNQHWSTEMEDEKEVADKYDFILENNCVH
jgi:hypothetical protein